MRLLLDKREVAVQRLPDASFGVGGILELVMSKKCRIGLDGRCRDYDGEIREKRGDTLVRTLREIYVPTFAPGMRSDTRLDTLREREGVDSLSELLRRYKKPSSA